MVVRSMVWVVLLVSVILGTAFVGLATASPQLQEDVSCRWLRLAASDARTMHTLIDMPLRGVVAYAGAETSTEASDVLDDVSLFRLSSGLPGAWQPISTTGEAPGDRMNHAAVLRTNPIGGFQMITYGGVDRLPGGGTSAVGAPVRTEGAPASGRDTALAPAEVRHETHVLDMLPIEGRWSIVEAANADARTEHSAVYRSSRDEVVVFGGRRTDEAGSVVDTVLRLAFAPEIRWDELEPAGDGPSARMGHSAVYDEGGDRMIVFGGTADYTTTFTETWSLNFAGDMPTWELMATTGTPPAGRFAHAAVYLPDLRWMVVYGGTSDGSGDLGDLFALDLSEAPPRWLELQPAGNQQPAPMQGVAAAYSSSAQVAVFYGGQAAGTAQGEAWALQCERIDATPTATPTNTMALPTATETAVPSTTPTADPSAVPTTASPAATATTTAVTTATTPSAATATPTTGPQGLEMSGRIAEARAIPEVVIEGATIRVPPCNTPHQDFEATTGPDGRYALVLPAGYFAPGCLVEVNVTASGYEPVKVTIDYTELVTNPVRDFALEPIPVTNGTTIFMPFAEAGS